MPLSPQDIVRREFREALRGYNQADVDLFLDEVVEEFSRLTEENQKMKVRLAALQQEVARFREGRSGPPSATAAVREEPVQVEAEVRSRLRRMLEDLLRQIDAAPAPSAASVPPEPRPPAARRDPRREPDQEPFWAGE